MPAQESMAAVDLDLTGFDLAWLATLASVAETGSFTQAGLRLGLTQSAVSQQVAALERWAGAELLRRRPVALTDAGRLVLGHHNALRAQVARLGTELADLREGRLGTIRVAAFLSACRALVPKALAVFRRDHPLVRVVLSQVEPGPALAALRAGDVDLAIVFGYGTPEIPSPLVPVPLFDEPVLLAVPADHPLAGLSGVDLGQVDPTELVAAPDASLPTIWSDAARTHYEGDDFSVVLALVAAGHGVAPVPRLAVTPPPAGVALVPLAGAGPASRRIWAVAPESADQPPVTALIRALTAGSPTAGTAAV